MNLNTFDKIRVAQNFEGFWNSSTKPSVFEAIQMTAFDMMEDEIGLEKANDQSIQYDEMGPEYASDFCYFIQVVTKVLANYGKFTIK